MYQIDLTRLPRALREGLTPIMVAHTALMTSAPLAEALEDILAVTRMNEAKAQVLEHPYAISGYRPGVASLSAINWMRSPPPRGKPASVANDLAEALSSAIRILEMSAAENPEGHAAVIDWIKTDLAQLCHRAFCFNTAKPPPAVIVPHGLSRRLRLVVS